MGCRIIQSFYCSRVGNHLVPGHFVASDALASEIISGEPPQCQTADCTENPECQYCYCLPVGRQPCQGRGLTPDIASRIRMSQDGQAPRPLGEAMRRPACDPASGRSRGCRGGAGPVRLHPADDAGRQHQADSAPLALRGRVRRRASSSRDRRPGPPASAGPAWASHHQVAALLQELAADVGVGEGGDRQHHRLDPLSELLERAQALGAPALLSL